MSDGVDNSKSLSTPAASKLGSSAAASPPALGALDSRNVPTLPKAPAAPVLPTKRAYRTYTELERTSSLVLVAAVGINDASRALGVPQRTLRDWVAAAGGLAGLTGAVRHALDVTRYALALKVYDALARKLPSMEAPALLDTLKALAVGSAAGLPEGGPNAGEAHADARAAIVVQLVGPNGVEAVPLDAADHVGRTA